MIYRIHSVGLKLTKTTNKRIQKKLSFLGTYLKESEVVDVYVHKEKEKLSLKIIAPTINKELIIIKDSDEDFYNCLDNISKRFKRVYVSKRDRYASRKKRKRIAASSDSISEFEELLPYKDECPFINCLMQLKYES